MPFAIVVTKQLLLPLMISYIANNCKKFATAVSEVIFGGRLLSFQQQFLYLRRSSSLRTFQNTNLDVSSCQNLEHKINIIE